MHNSALRWAVSLSLGTLVTLGLFWFMHYMIRSDDALLGERDVYKIIDFVQMNRQESQPEIKKELPPEPEKPKEAPKMASEALSDSDTEPDHSPQMQIAMPGLGADGSLVQGAPKMLGPIKVAKIDSALTPMMQIKPVYPSKAKRMGIEGFVTAELEVDPTGHVTEITILKSQPEGIFDKSVHKALKRWKFRPKTVDGKAVAQKGVLTLNFTLEDQ